MKFNVDEKRVSGKLEIGEKEYNYAAYPLTFDLSLKLAKAQKNQDEILLLEVIKEYFDECVEFEKGFLNNPKEEVKKLLDRSGKLAEFVMALWEELGKLNEKKD